MPRLSHSSRRPGASVASRSAAAEAGTAVKDTGAAVGETATGAAKDPAEKAKGIFRSVVPGSKDKE